MEYTLKDFLKFGITKRQLIHWCEQNIIIPAQDDRRRGGVRRFSQQNLVESLICRELNKYGLPTEIFRLMMEALRIFKFWENLPLQAEIPFLVYVPMEIQGQETMGVRAIASDSLVDFVRKYPSVIVVDLAKLIKEAGGYR